LSFIERVVAIPYHKQQTSNKVSTRFISCGLLLIFQCMPDLVAQLAELLAKNCKVQKVQPTVFASDAEVNIVTVTVVCPDGTTHTIRAYREQAQAVREFIRTKT
jgi:hypothetical protein